MSDLTAVDLAIIVADQTTDRRAAIADQHSHIAGIDIGDGVFIVADHATDLLAKAARSDSDAADQ